MRDATVWGMIDARPITFPAPVHELSSALLEFTVPAEAARSLVAGDAFELVESADGTASLLLGANDYRRGAWGPCIVIEVMLRARPAGAPAEADGVYLCDAPVSHPFIREAAHRSLRCAHRLETVEVAVTDDHATFTQTCEGHPGMTLRVPRVPSGGEPVRITTQAYSHVDDEPYSIPFEIDLPLGRVEPGDVHIELGSGWFADMLRGLGLPRRPEWCSWGEGLTALFHMAEPLAKTEDASRVRHAEAGGGPAADPGDGQASAAPVSGSKK